MAKIVFLSCTKSKKDKLCPAQELYSESPMFQKTLEYGKKLKPNKMFILSAKHHIVPLDKKLAPYELTLKDMGKDEKQSWGEYVSKQAPKLGINLSKDKFIFLTGNEYSKPLTDYIPEQNMSFPLEGKRFGERLQWLNQQINEVINKIKLIIHESLKRRIK